MYVTSMYVLKLMSVNFLSTFSNFNFPVIHKIMSFGNGLERTSPLSVASPNVQVPLMVFLGCICIIIHQ